MSFKRVLNLKNIVNVNNTSRIALKRTPLQNRLKLYYSTTPATPDVAVEAPKDIKVSLDVNIGQPHYLTHPHLIQPNEITVGIPNLEYQLRRQKLVESLPKGSAVVCIGNNLQFKDHNIFHQFHQNPNLLYLTGFNQPDGAMILEPDSSNHKGYKMTLLVSPKDPKVELWEGAKCGLENAVNVFEADEAINIKEFTSTIKNIFKEYDTVFLDLPHDVIMHSKEHSLQNMIFNEKWQSKVKKLKPLLDDLRVLKSKYESDLIRTAGKIAGRSFVSTMRFTADKMRLNHAEPVKNRLTEHDVANHFEYNCRLQGSQGNSFVPVVAGGNHALSLHYVANDSLINNGDMIMMDAGAFYHGYGSDVTRSWPINGKFTEPQRNLYQAVLNVQKKCIKMCTVKEEISLNEILLRSLDLMLEELHKIGIHCSYKTLQNQLYPHHISHYLGLGIHDTPSVSRTRKLVPGMVVTIEPGIYIPYDNQFPKEYQGIGIRIEDDILVTDLDEPIVLSAEAPKEIADIEYVCSQDTDLHLNL